MKEEKIVLRTLCGCRQGIQVVAGTNHLIIPLRRPREYYSKDPMGPDTNDRRTFTYYGKTERYYEGFTTYELRVFEEE
jgi:hypothetical protein